MPYRRRASSNRRSGMGLRPVDSMKNVTVDSGGLTGTLTEIDLVLSQDNPTTAQQNGVSRGSVVKNIWVSLDTCGLGGTGVLNNFQAYLWKNPGNNLTPPTPGTEGTSNEKKFIFRTWSGMIMRNQDGNAPLHWEGWVRIPKRYQRMGTDDTISIVLVVTSALTGHFFVKSIYKWFR